MVAKTCPRISPTLSRKRSTRVAAGSSTSIVRITTTRARSGKVSATYRSTRAPNATTARTATYVRRSNGVVLDELVDPATAALIVVDMQNDFCHHDGAQAAMGSNVSLAGPMA